MLLERTEFTTEEKNMINNVFKAFIKTGLNYVDKNYWWDLKTLLEINTDNMIQTQKCFEFGETWTIKKYVDTDNFEWYTFEKEDENGIEYEYIEIFNNKYKLERHLTKKSNIILEGYAKIG